MGWIMGIFTKNSYNPNPFGKVPIYQSLGEMKLLNELIYLKYNDFVYKIINF